MRDPARWAVLLAAAWLGLLLAVGAIAAPAAFAALPAGDAGKVVARLFAREADTSIALGIALMLLSRSLARRAAAAEGATLFSTDLMLALGAITCTVAGYHALQPLMDAARAGSGPFSFGQLHAAGMVLFGLKMLLVGALAWRLSRPRTPSSSS